jgi:hypothetical protein
MHVTPATWAHKVSHGLQQHFGANISYVIYERESVWERDMMIMRKQYGVEEEMIT